MCIPPYLDDPEKVRSYFQRLRTTRDECRARYRSFAFRPLHGHVPRFRDRHSGGATEVRHRHRPLRLSPPNLTPVPRVSTRIFIWTPTSPEAILTHRETLLFRWALCPIEEIRTALFAYRSLHADSPSNASLETHSVPHTSATQATPAPFGIPHSWQSSSNTSPSIPIIYNPLLATEVSSNPASQHKLNLCGVIREHTNNRPIVRFTAPRRNRQIQKRNTAAQPPVAPCVLPAIHVPNAGNPRWPTVRRSFSSPAPSPQETTSTPLPPSKFLSVFSPRQIPLLSVLLEQTVIVSFIPVPSRRSNGTCAVRPLAIL